MLAIACLYLYDLDGVGVISPDEPRYIAIGRAMWNTGDYVTPRLWGTPWFEKPPLLYWLTSLGTGLHLGPELSGRLPVVLLSLAFLSVMFMLLRREFGLEAAAISSVLLATSAGWLTYSSLALTDLPLAVFFSLAVLLALPLTRTQPGESQPQAIRLLLIGGCLGLAALAKGLVPLALALPFCLVFAALVAKLVAGHCRRFGSGAALVCQRLSPKWPAVPYRLFLETSL